MPKIKTPILYLNNPTFSYLIRALRCYIADDKLITEAMSSEKVIEELIIELQKLSKNGRYIR